MTGLLKLIPLVALLGGGVAVYQHSGEFFHRVVGKVKVLVTGYEVASIASEVLAYSLEFGKIPGVNDGQDFSTYLRDYFKPRLGKADPALDLWEQPFLIQRGLEESTLIVSSSGPNAQDDDCALLNGRPTSDDAALALEAANDPEAALAEDDICASFTYSLRDSPFRPIQQ